MPGMAFPVNAGAGAIIQKVYDDEQVIYLDRFKGIYRIKCLVPLGLSKKS
jgi:hypothetical protein